jgi:hypothetical protein
MNNDEVSEEQVGEELAIVHDRGAANWVGAALIIGISALATMLITVPPAPTESENPAPPTAIGGGPSPASEEGLGGMVCRTADGAPYIAENCLPE